MSMRKIHRYFASLVLALSVAVSGMAQTLNVGGVTMNNDIVGWGDLYELSFTSHNYGTARSMAMGNAFTALGADLVSGSLNPAGIGMYVNSDFSFSPMIQHTKSPTKGADDFLSSEFKDKNTRFGFSNLGVVLTTYRGAGALTNFNIGVTYNRIADFNQNYKFASFGNPASNSLANLFCEMSNADGLMTNSDGTMSFGDDPYYWGAVLAYKNGLTNKDAQGWFIDRIGSNAFVDQFTSVETRGSIGEYAFSFGFNFVDKFYLGVTLGVQSVNYSRNVYYGENYLYDAFPSGDEMPYQLEYMNYLQSTTISGTGVNLKVGFTWRPVHWLRIGAAYHTPTGYNLSLQYWGDMWSETFSAGSNPEGYDVGKNGTFEDYVQSPGWEDTGNYAWRVSSPSRFLVGAAATIGQRLIISADYESSLYNKTRLRGSPIYDLDYREVYSSLFKSSNTVRVGAEFRLLPAIDIRAGYIWSGSSLNYPDEIYTHPVTKSRSYITAGLGFKLSNTVNLDLAYQYGHGKSTLYQSFYATNEAVQIESVPVTTDTYKHIALLTLGFRF